MKPASNARELPGFTATAVKMQTGSESVPIESAAFLLGGWLMNKGKGQVIVTADNRQDYEGIAQMLHGHASSKNGFFISGKIDQEGERVALASVQGVNNNFQVVLPKTAI